MLKCFWIWSQKKYCEGSQQNQHTKQQNKNNKNWNPFEDMKNFAELTEEALVDQEFDQLRENERKDPFQSAPFALNH